MIPESFEKYIKKKKISTIHFSSVGKRREGQLCLGGSGAAEGKGEGVCQPESKQIPRFGGTEPQPLARRGATLDHLSFQMT